MCIGWPARTHDGTEDKAVKERNPPSKKVISLINRIKQNSEKMPLVTEMDDWKRTAAKSRHDTYSVTMYSKWLNIDYQGIKNQRPRRLWSKGIENGFYQKTCGETGKNDASKLDDTEFFFRKKIKELTHTHCVCGIEILLCM